MLPRPEFVAWMREQIETSIDQLQSAPQSQPQGAVSAQRGRAPSRCARPKSIHSFLEMSEASSPVPFDAERAAAYDDRIRRLAPGYDVLHEAIACVADTLLPPDAHVLVVGAGTGAEIVTMGEVQPGWRFTAVDPSAEMLDRCRSAVADAGLERRVEYVQARIEQLSAETRFDGATSVFVSHFLQDPAKRRRYFQAVAHALHPNAPLVLADLFRPSSDVPFEQLLATWRRSLRLAGITPDEVERIFDRIDRQMSFISGETLEQILDDAGFGTSTRFYQSFLWGGWWTKRT
jgi:tRNA (cmo5U34)-methyltransferase